MIDPKFITDYKRNDAELDEFAIFCVCVAGKNAHTTARAVDKMVGQLKIWMPDLLPLEAIFQLVFDTGLAGLSHLIKDCRMGNYNKMAATLYGLADMANDNKNFLRTCTVEQLESIKGIGSKTARFFLLHSRPNQRICAVDTHILKLLRDIGYPNVPKTTPPKGTPQYRRLEDAFLKWCDHNGYTDYAAADLANWNKYSLDGLKTPAIMGGVTGETNGKNQ